VWNEIVVSSREVPEGGLACGRVCRSARCAAPGSECARVCHSQGAEQFRLWTGREAPVDVMAHGVDAAGAETPAQLRSGA